jgi:hypothetical protein
MAFGSLFSNVAAKLFGDAAAAARPGTVEPELVQIATEAIVEAVDPRLRVVSGYQRKIQPGVIRTIAHLRELAKDLPQRPLELSRGAWGTNQELGAFFATAADVPAALGRSAQLRAYFESPINAGATEAYALLGMLKTEREVFAPALVDGALRHDVAQTTVSFSTHTLVAPAPDIMACRRAVGVLIFQRLAALALERITALGERATELEQRKALLGARLRLLNLRRDGLEQVAGAADESAEMASLERELKATGDEFAETRTRLATLDTRLEHVNAILNAPAEYVSITRVDLRVNKMGFKLAAGSSEPAVDLKLSELAIGSGLKAVIALVRCQRAEMPPRESLIAKAAREIL